MSMAVEYGTEAGLSVTITNGGSAVAKGDVFVAGNFLGVAPVAIAASVNGELKISGRFVVAKKTSQAWAVGDDVFWDASNSWCTTDATKGLYFGTVQVAAGSSDTTGKVMLMAGSSPKAANVPTMTDSTSGVVSVTTPPTLIAVRTDTAGHVAADAATNFATLNAQVNLIIAAMRAAGMMV